MVLVMIIEANVLAVNDITKICTLHENKEWNRLEKYCGFGARSSLTYIRLLCGVIEPIELC